MSDPRAVARSGLGPDEAARSGLGPDDDRPARSWVDAPPGSPFGLANLPYGVIETLDGAHLAVAIGAQVLDLTVAASEGLVDDPDRLLAGPTLNPFLAAGRRQWTRVRSRLTQLLSDEQFAPQVTPLLRDARTAVHRLGWDVADYADFYSCEQHAMNLGRILRPNEEPLKPNWRRIPIGYHGRSGTVVVSGTAIRRPWGVRVADGEGPTYGPSGRLDIEAEVGFVVGTPSTLGRPVTTADFAAHVFGVVLVNDWSARDIQGYEYQPLGPFLGKSFATSVSPWVVPLDALQDARVAPPRQDPQPADYLRSVEPWGLDVVLQVRLNGELISRPPFAGMYWTPDQQLAHLTANGARVRTGDLFASGTVSGDSSGETGSLIELTWNGAEPLRLADGGERSFLEDGDTVTITATTRDNSGPHIGFGDVHGTITPAASRRLDAS